MVGSHYQATPSEAREDLEGTVANCKVCKLVKQL
jgi:hypothetical protein